MHTDDRHEVELWQVRVVRVAPGVHAVPDRRAHDQRCTAEEGDLYFAKVQAEILSHYTIPSIISERERMALKAVVVAWIAPDGKLVRYQFDRRSGNAQFDSALERAIKASRIPAPPPERARAIRDEGVALEFTP